MLAPTMLFWGSTTLLVAVGAGMVFAQVGQSIATTAITAILSLATGGGLLSILKAVSDIKTNKAIVDRTIGDLKAQHDKEIMELRGENERLKKEVHDGADERRKIEETSEIQRDILLIQVQDLKVGEEWYRIQLGIATGKVVPPKPPLFTPEADKLLGDSGTFSPSTSVVPAGYDILVVDDSATSVLNMKKLLRIYGCIVRTASNAAQALHFVEQRKPDTIITDLLMPGGNGTEIIRKIRGAGDLNTRIIVVTGVAQPNLVIEAQELGADAVLHKPYEAQRLIEMVIPMEMVSDPSDHPI
jgi:CheY-like chemotaxis protein